MAKVRSMGENRLEFMTDPHKLVLFRNCGHSSLTQVSKPTNLYKSVIKDPPTPTPPPFPLTRYLQELISEKNSILNTKKGSKSFSTALYP